eukprot:scaffold123021_cov41-Tisochrysis_lutea.AAC.1
MKEQQAAFQALKKATGNTHTARGGALNLGVFLFISVGCTAVTLRGLKNMAYGTNKYEYNED